MRSNFRVVNCSRWLDHIDMKYYKNLFKRAGVTDMFQLESFTKKVCNNH